ncbi:MAG: pilus assembly protein PilM, partial [Clostridium sp.]|nr:pilus assembly protein PilM [Clostridium sp.]
NNKNLNNKIDCIYIFGGASNISGFEKYFSDKLGINTKKVTNMNKSTFNSHDDGSYIDEYINAIGALIRIY